jgi:hypothetical protein
VKDKGRGRGEEEEESNKPGEKKEANAIEKKLMGDQPLMLDKASRMGEW